MKLAVSSRKRTLQKRSTLTMESSMQRKELPLSLPEGEATREPKEADCQLDGNEVLLSARQQEGEILCPIAVFPPIQPSEVVASIADLPHALELFHLEVEKVLTNREWELRDERVQLEKSVLNVYPKNVAQQMLDGHPVREEYYENVAVFFSDIVGFTKLSTVSSASEIRQFLDDLYCQFDEVIKRHDVYKVETIGDAYMLVAGLPEGRNRTPAYHCKQILSAALELLDVARLFIIRHRADEALKIRIGIHTGPCVAGVVGRTMPRYCLFGKTVNIASRMESTSEAMMIQISDNVRDTLELSEYAKEFETFFNAVKEVKGGARLYATYFATEPEADELASQRLQYYEEKNLL